MILRYRDRMGLRGLGLGASASDQARAWLDYIVAEARDGISERDWTRARKWLVRINGNWQLPVQGVTPYPDVLASLPQGQNLSLNYIQGGQTTWMAERDSLQGEIDYAQQMALEDARTAQLLAEADAARQKAITTGIQYATGMPVPAEAPAAAAVEDWGYDTTASYDGYAEPVDADVNGALVAAAQEGQMNWALLLGGGAVVALAAFLLARVLKKR